MKVIFLITTFLSMLHFSSQEKIWIDENGNTTNKENATYYRVFSDARNDKQQVTDYYISNKIAREFLFKNGKPEGKYSEYYSTGEVKITGDYENGFKEGIWKTYYKSGKIKEKGKYKKGEKIGVWKTFYRNN